MQDEKANTILATRAEERFEFSDPRQLPDGRVLANVRNNSHDVPGKHVYPVFFHVEKAGTGVTVRVADGGCPAAEYHDETCKHCLAASESAELLGRVIETALEDGGEDEEQDAHASEGSQMVATDGGRPSEEKGTDEPREDIFATVGDESKSTQKVADSASEGYQTTYYHLALMEKDGVINSNTHDGIRYWSLVSEVSE